MPWAETPLKGLAKDQKSWSATCELAMMNLQKSAPDCWFDKQQRRRQICVLSLLKVISRKSRTHFHKAC